MATKDVRISFKLEDRKVGNEDLVEIKAVWLMGGIELATVLRMIEQHVTPKAVMMFGVFTDLDQYERADWYVEDYNGKLLASSTPIDSGKLEQEREEDD